MPGCSELAPGGHFGAKCAKNMRFEAIHELDLDLAKLKVVNGVPLSPPAQVQPKHGSRILAVSWQFDHAEARGSRSLAYSPHAKPALTHCLSRQVKSRQWSAPLASSKGATEARIQDLGSQLTVRSCRSMWSLAHWLTRLTQSQH